MGTFLSSQWLAPRSKFLSVILRRQDEEKWLDPNITDAARLTSLLVPHPSEVMESYVVSGLVNSSKNDRPECIAAVGT